MKLSIIVPVYKVEPYLRRCVDSILEQTFTDFELILVDDGSPDGCPAICDEYAQLDSRVIVIHKPNGGISDARNAGLDIARGNYIGFVDGDDYIDPAMYQHLLERAERYHAQISQMSFYRVDTDGTVIEKCTNLEQNGVYQRDSFLDHYFPFSGWIQIVVVWNKVYEKKLFSSYRFPVGKIYEDSFSQLPLYDLCQTIAVSKECGYYYTVERAGSIMNTTFSERNLQLVDLGMEQYDFFVKKGLREQQNFALLEYVNKYLQVLFAIDALKPELRPQFGKYKKSFCGHLIRILKNPEICRMKKIAAALSVIWRPAAYRIVRRYFPECLLPSMR